jgi:hypothetical protein
MNHQELRITLTTTGRLNWHWRVEYESCGDWWTFPWYQRASGNALTRRAAERRARHWTRRYRNQQHAWNNRRSITLEDT